MKKITNHLVYLIRESINFINKDLFVVDSFEFLRPSNNIRVYFHVFGKRTKMSRLVTDIATDESTLTCFGKKDISEICFMYGRIYERSKK